MSDKLWILLQSFSSFSLFGLIWFVQILHYSLMRYIPREAFLAYHKIHTRRAGLLIGPLMIFESACAICLVLFLVDIPYAYFHEANLISILGIWLSTFMIQVPIHQRLAGGFSVVEIEKLIRSNWIRTSLWSFRALMLLLVLSGI